MERPFGRDGSPLEYPMPARDLTAHSQRSWRAFPLCVLALVSVACDGRSASDAGESIAEMAPPSATLSRFDVPLDYDFTPILREVERVVPRTLGSLDSLHAMPSDERRMYAYQVTRGPFTVFMRGSDVHFASNLSYAVRGLYNPPVGPNISASCGRGDAKPEIRVELVTPLSVDSSWHLTSRARLAQLVAASDSVQDRCRISFLRIDITDRVVEAARDALTDHLGDIDDEIAKVDLTDQVTEWWAELSKPIQLTDGVWLLLRPRQLRAGQVSGRGRVLTLRVGLDAMPTVATGAEPPLEVTPLPPLIPDTSTSGFRIVVDGVLDYLTASREITDQVKGRSLRRSGRSVEVQSVTVTPAAGGRLALTVGFTGDASGTVRFAGTPTYDAARGLILVPDLDYDLETRNPLIRVFAWFRSDALRNLLRERAQMPVGPVVERGKGLLLEGLNRTIGESITLSATVDTVTVEGIYVTRGGVVVRGGASGEAKVSIREEE